MSDALSTIGSAAVSTIGTVAVVGATAKVVNNSLGRMNRGGGGGAKRSKNYNVWNGSKKSSKSKHMLRF